MLKKVLAGAGILLVVGVAVILWYWRQATALPDWYTEAGVPQMEAYQGEAHPDASPRWIAIAEDGTATPSPTETPVDFPDQAQPPADLPTPEPRPKAKPKRHELRGFHRRNGKNPGETAVRASRAIYEGGELEAGVILDLSRLPREDLAPKNRDLFDRAIRNFPGLSRRDVYVGIEDDPIVKDGIPRLGPHPRIRVGKLQYSLDKAARKLGMTPDDLRRELDRELQRLGLPLQN